MPTRRRKTQRKQLGQANLQNVPMVPLTAIAGTGVGHVARDIGVGSRRGKTTGSAGMSVPAKHTPGIDLQAFETFGLSVDQSANLLDWYRNIY